ncbi:MULTISPECIES: TonB-dependent siderophore receptor [Methylobacterium]|jgi:iron complex outermembrane receptor protein|uniref:Ferrioxamine B receptor n=1 Tax=Methylobacterium phyllosphaerae TaxID=418223 RepID=A0AAE8L4L9_9HYPH|nr:MULTISPECIES: TonB-dependent siderophore receptor [Methylobacterium]APT30696.1 ferrioxamine B receptor [Methylobacterium phyllosphaerae]MDH3027790.1 TonB-dependent siderophore receptor [Methylobacterium fujisawaense]RUP12007.1 MAG: TonB-dependent siderophore receptor [Methylobacterium sp.]SFG23654.1 iron complex outermembrane recepter protein [Methylobacterium phyllosphaerae]SFU31818.1 iron complex outermembrane recepter protein [Methylobacterium sp. UNCCL125]
MPADQIDAVDQAKYYRSCLILYRAGLATALLFSSPAEVLAQSAPTADEVVLSELSVTGTGPVGERADGPVIGYRATRSATATRTDTPVRDSPQSINIVPRAVLTDQQDLRLTDAVTNVSNVVLGSTIQGRSQNYLIRGFSTQVFAVDGVLVDPAINFYPVTRDLVDAERVEVIKGPASMLFGRGDPGGVINIVTRRPTLEPTADASVQGGSFGFRRFQGSVSSALPAVEGLAARLSFAAQEDPTFRNFGGDTNRRVFVAPAFSWTPSADTRVYVNSEFTNQHSQYDEGLVAFRGRVPLDNISRFYGEPSSRYSGAFNTITMRAEHDVNENLMLRQIVSGQWGTFDVFAARAESVNTAGTLVNRRESAVNSRFAAVDTQSEAVMKFETFGLAHTGLLGIEYSNGFRHALLLQGNLAPVSFLTPVFGAAFQPLRFQSDLKQKLEVYGFYAQDQIVLAPGLQLVVGARFDLGSQYYFSRVPASKSQPPEQTLFGASPRVGLIYRPFEPLTFYASYATSFLPQTASVLNVTSPPPSTGDQIEVGTRVDLNPGLTLSAAAFRITRDNVAATDPQNPTFSVITGQQQSQGVEADLAGEILPGWNIIGSVGLIDARITKDTTFAIGNRLAGVPVFSGSLWTTYDVQHGPLRGLGLGFGITHVGQRYGDLNNSFTVGAYNRLDALVYYDFDAHWRLSVNMRNLTNARYIEAPTSVTNNTPGAPFTVLATITARL